MKRPLRDNTLASILFLHVLLLGHLADQPRESAARSKCHRKGRELIHRAGNYQAAAAIEPLQSKPDDVLVRLLAARDFFSFALLGLFRIGAQTPRANGDYS